MNVEELLNDKGVRFKSAGKDVLVKCLSPEHTDRNPSMRIDRITGVFNCFSCGFKGNIFEYYNEYVDTLSIKILQLKKKISDIMKNDMLLPLGKEPFKRDHRGISSKTYEHFNAFVHDNYDGRIVFPIHDITGKLIALIGRYAFSDASPKYLLDPPSVKVPVFPPDPEIYKGSVILVEGIFDVLNLYDKGLKNVVCAFGKSLGDTRNKRKRAENLNKFIPLKIQGVKKIYVLYDKGAESSEEKTAKFLSELFISEPVKYPLFTDEKDAGNMTYEEVQDLKEDLYESSSS